MTKKCSASATTTATSTSTSSDPPPTSSHSVRRYPPLTFAVTVISCGVLIPLFYSEEEPQARNQLQVVTIANVLDSDEKLWIVYSLSLIASLLAYLFILQFKKRVDRVMRFHSEEEFGDADIAVHTLEVKGVPRKLRIRGGDNMLFQFFRENYRDGVVCAHIVPSLNLLEEAMQ